MLQYHVFAVNKQNYLFFVENKQLFLLNDKHFNILKEPQNKTEVNSVLNIYKEHLSKEDFLEDMIVDAKRYGLFLCISNDCNARCTYCFAHQGDYGKSRGIMDSKVAKRAIDFYMKKVPDYATAYIIFFGGEPLLATKQIIETCEYVKSNYANRDYHFHIVTNGTLLDINTIDYLKDNNFGIGISIDGGREIQNKQRPLANGKDSYDETTKNLDYLLKSIDNVHARGTYCDYNQSLVKIHKDLLALGFKEVNVPPDILNSKSNESQKKLFNELDEFYEYILNYTKKNNSFPFGLFKDKIRSAYLPKFGSNYGCGLGKTTFSVDINGNIYPCHRFTALDEFKIGNVSDNTKVKDFIFTSTKCKNCWNRYTCTHGCSYNDYEIEHSLTSKNQYFCSYSQKMSELALALCNELQPDILNEIMA